jgi:hypothetical protein
VFPIIHTFAKDIIQMAAIENISRIRDLSIIQKVILTLLFSGFVLIGLKIAGDYGVAWDDHLQTTIGKQNLEYALGENQDIFQNVDRYYGSAFELPLYYFQSFFTSFSSQVYVRHLITHMYFLFALLMFFKLILRLLKSFPFALLGVLLIYLQPRIFAHSFFNTKDLPFLSTFIISLYTLWMLVEAPTDKRRIILHSFVSAFLIDIRLVGFIAPALSIGILAFIYIPQRRLKEVVLPILSYSLLTAVFVYMLWPTLWLHPILLFESFARMAHFPWRYTNLIAGQTVLATQNPWFYIPLWIGITTPVAILIAWFTGVGFAIKNLFSNDNFLLDSRQVFMVSLAFLPIDLWLFFLILKPTFYDGWRHLFFISPLLVIGAVYGAYNFFRAVSNRKYLAIIVGLTILFLAIVPAVKMIIIHPYQQVYFNILTSKKDNHIRENYEMDYWGLSYKEGFDKLLKLDSNTNIKVFVANIAALDNAKLADEDTHRITIVEKIEDADYFITNYRFHPQEFPYKKVINIDREGSCILGVYKLKD